MIFWKFDFFFMHLWQTPCPPPSLHIAFIFKRNRSFNKMKLRWLLLDLDLFQCSVCNSLWTTEDAQSVSVSGQWEEQCKFGASFSGVSFWHVHQFCCTIQVFVFFHFHLISCRYVAVKTCPPDNLSFFALSQRCWVPVAHQFELCIVRLW